VKSANPEARLDYTDPLEMTVKFPSPCLSILSKPKVSTTSSGAVEAGN
jgi:hypothetical protein